MHIHRLAKLRLQRKGDGCATTMYTAKLIVCSTCNLLHHSELDQTGFKIYEENTKIFLYPISLVVA